MGVIRNMATLARYFDVMPARSGKEGGRRTPTMAEEDAKREVGANSEEVK